MQNDRQDDKQALEQLNIEIGNKESEGNSVWLDGVIAPKLAFQRADGTTFDNREEFLGKVMTSRRRETKVESIAFYGNRAVVSCIVTLKSASGDESDDESFHNLRLFVQHEGKWKLLGWANEPW
jgi:hypothetical protein